MGRTRISLLKLSQANREFYFFSRNKSDKYRMADEDQKTEHINLKVAGQDGSVVQFKIKKHTPLRKLMQAYCDRQGLQISLVRFRFDGNPVKETDSPEGLEMEDEDTIDVFQSQTGGN